MSDISQVSDVLQVSDILQVSDVLKVSDILQVSDVLQVSDILQHNCYNVGVRSIVVELGTSMPVVVGSNPAQTGLVSTFVRA